MQRLSVDIKLPSLAKRHSCKEHLDIFINKRLEKMKNDMEKLSIKCQNDLFEFVDQVSALESRPGYVCQWIEGEEKTPYAAYFLYLFQAEDCKIHHRPDSKIEHATVFQDKYNKKYYILDDQDCMKKIEIYIPLSLEEKENHMRKLEIAKLERKLRCLRKGGIC
jgi:hypothetical protein